MAGAAKKSLFAPGIVPFLQKKALELPLPETVKGFLAHPAGPFTIHFWAPTFKWAISIANIMDLNRPVDKLSAPQQTAVAATGIIWSRYSMVIVPKNWNLFSVNVFMAITGSWQLYRVFMWRQYGKQVTLDGLSGTKKEG
uniref:Mitochondrial pyruvate carrier n=1 Tax=Chromera velia CCMP2878 TaxID=1169474 RepID=A0A0G4HNS8_9ALVE|mmetsp:Transcript_50865/g.100010  ORF Transcript_50865/g.100010 Transcript_50865/m.100010 type:complete len:140 (+) Transcript_50865:234-653(+)|eukprot:Cvel_29592.t1-p1 / transcript=Cvel_29592.t1 / gene=Cvel_29592 / organism=Chromera_velia_CCMP2878 / gene_product=Mitochondrial pyruvate carrier 2, putative / transcript_product=Mitochondrial pyruvate carrier 2, putative / location=Cvel_scaffold4077:5893-8046(+) / protein_length=139 / sequence_SO=supercontig / SO=protein_coding / is_pseudo=false